MNDKELREIRRRFRPDKSNITAVRGCFVNDNKEIISQFSQSILLSNFKESEQLLAVMKKSLSGSLGTNLLDVEFSTKQVMEGEEHALLMALRKSELKDDAAINEFYKRVIESVNIDGNYVIMLACDNYDVFTYTSDGEKEDSFEVFTYIICSICPIKQLSTALYFKETDNLFHSLDAEAVLSNPRIGFMFPTFEDRKANIYHTLYYTKDISDIQPEFVNRIFNAELPMPAAKQKETFDECLKETLEAECDYEVMRSVHEQITEMVQLHKDAKEEEPLTLTKDSLKNVLQYCGVDEERVEAFGKKYDESFGENVQLAPKNIVTLNKFELNTPDVTIKVNPERKELVSTQIINGVKYIMIKATDGVEVNGVNISIN